MANYDLRLDIPARAYINAQLLGLLQMGGTLWEAKKQLFSTGAYANAMPPEQVYAYKPHDHALAVSLLYCTLVVPREILDFPENHQIFRDFDAEKVTAAFAIAAPAGMTSYRFVRCLRDSVAQALFSIREEGGEAHYEFWTEGEPAFRASIGHKALIAFLSVVGQRLANAAQARK